MEIENQAKKYGVCDLEYAKKLKELGVKQNSLFYWVVYKNGHTVVYYYREDDGGGTEVATHPNSRYSAFTVAELNNELGRYSENQLEKARKYLCISKWELLTLDVNRRAKMLIYLLENKLMEY